MLVLLLNMQLDKIYIKISNYSYLYSLVVIIKYKKFCLLNKK